MATGLDWVRRVIRIRGLQTAVYSAGDSDAPLVLLLHDGTYGSDAPLAWDAVAYHLAREFYIVAPDLLGWGGSEKVVRFGGSPYLFRLEHALEAMRVVAGDRDFSAVGTSFGGSLVLSGLSTTWMSRCTCAVSIGGTLGRFKQVEAFSKIGSYVPSLEGARMLTELLVANMQDLDKHVQRRYENSLIPGHWEALSAGRIRNPALTGPRPEAELAPSSVPVLLVEGSKDSLLLPGWSEALAIELAAESVVTPYGHSPNIDYPAETAVLISDFISDKLAR